MTLHGMPWRCSICGHNTYDDRETSCHTCGARRGASFACKTCPETFHTTAGARAHVLGYGHRGYRS